MSPRYAFVFGLLAVSCVFFGLVAAVTTTGVSLAFLYPGTSFALLAVAYGGVGPKLLGKRPNGGRWWWARLLFAPYLLLTRFSFLVYKLLGRHSASCEVVPKLLLGRRLTVRETSRFADIAVLDLAAEFGEAGPFRTPGLYLSLPVLDATPPTVEQLNNAVKWIADRITVRPVLVHCALGHGRSASVVIAFLLHSRQVASVKDGLRMLRQRRPGVGLSTSQRQALQSWHAARNPPAVA